MKKIYYMDGYHGGIRGHMPPGCWRDILDALKRNPDWKLSIDVEPVSWDYLKERDPQAYKEITDLLKDGSRLEIVAGSYAQPYGWITDGAELGAFRYENSGYTVRVFNTGLQTDIRFRSDIFTQMEEISPDGISDGHFLTLHDGCFSDEIPSFGIRTYRLS